jgi:antitoxin component YwqK of YwqJK toxin-antitoxin module
MFGVYDGIGVSYDDGGIKRYEGMYRRGLKSGKGKLFSDTGDVEYQGHWFTGQLDGKGTKYNKDGLTVELMYRGGKIVKDMDSYIEKGGISALFGKAMESKVDLSSIFGPKIGSNSPQKK